MICVGLVAIFADVVVHLAIFPFEAWFTSAGITTELVLTGFWVSHVARSHAVVQETFIDVFIARYPPNPRFAVAFKRSWQIYAWGSPLGIAYAIRVGIWCIKVSRKTFVDVGITFWTFPTCGMVRWGGLLFDSAILTDSELLSADSDIFERSCKVIKLRKRPVFVVQSSYLSYKCMFCLHRRMPLCCTCCKSNTAWIRSREAEIPSSNRTYTDQNWREYILLHSYTSFCCRDFCHPRDIFQRLLQFRNKHPWILMKDKCICRSRCEGYT